MAHKNKHVYVVPQTPNEFKLVNLNSRLSSKCWVQKVQNETFPAKLNNSF